MSTKNNKLFKILSLLSKDEWKKFGLFVHSSYFNSNKNIIKLHEVLNKHFPKFDTNKLSNEALYKQIYSNTTYKEGTIRNLISDTHDLLDLFFIQIERENQNYIYDNTLLLDAYSRRDELQNFITPYINKSNKYFDAITKRDEMYAFNKILSLIAKNRFELNHANVIDFGKNIEERHYEILAMNAIWSLLDFIHSLNVQISINKHDYKFEWLNETIQLVETIPYIKENYPVSELYVYLIKIVHFNQYEHIDYFQEIFEKTILQLVPVDACNIMILITNVYQKQFISLNEFKYESARFKLFKLMVKYNLLTQLGTDYIEPPIFRSIYLTAITNNEFDWATQFYNQYFTLLPIDAQEVTEVYCKFRFSFAKNDYEQAIYYASQVSNKYKPIYILARAYKLLAIFMLNDRNRYDTEYDSYIHMIKDPALKLSEIMQKNNILFAKFIQEIYKNKYQTARHKSKEIIKSEILTSNEQITCKEWMLNYLSN
jgi:DNA-binding Lrp family transcriptional regulator